MASAEVWRKGAAHDTLKVSFKVTYPPSAAQDFPAPAQLLEPRLVPRCPISLPRLETYLPLPLQFQPVSKLILVATGTQLWTHSDPDADLPRTLTWFVTQTDRQDLQPPLWTGDRAYIRHKCSQQLPISFAVKDSSSQVQAHMHALSAYRHKHSWRSQVS